MLIFKRFSNPKCLLMFFMHIVLMLSLIHI